MEESCKWRIDSWWVTVSRFVPAELLCWMSTFNTTKGSYLGKQVEEDIPSDLTSHNRLAGLPSQVNFTVEIGQVWRQDWEWTMEFKTKCGFSVKGLCGV